MNYLIGHEIPLYCHDCDEKIDQSEPHILCLIELQVIGNLKIKFISICPGCFNVIDRDNIPTDVKLRVAGKPQNYRIRSPKCHVCPLDGIKFGSAFIPLCLVFGYNIEYYGYRCGICQKNCRISMEEMEDFPPCVKLSLSSIMK